MQGMANNDLRTDSETITQVAYSTFTVAALYAKRLLQASCGTANYRRSLSRAAER